MKETVAGPRALIVGANGQVGKQIMGTLSRNACIPTARFPRLPECLSLDLAAIDKEGATKLLAPFDLNAIYCVGGMTNVELCEVECDLAMRTNCTGPKTLAEIAEERHIPFVYFSTEYIFDGADGPYDEDAQARPISGYGRSKWLGEREVAAACSKALILRTTVVYGPDEAEKNFLYSLTRALVGGTSFKVPADQISTPTYNRDLAKAAVHLVESGATGVFHVCGPERLSRLQFATEAARLLGLDADLVIGVPTGSLNQQAARPLKAGLSTEKLRRLHPGIHMHGLSTSLSDWALSDGGRSGLVGMHLPPAIKPVGLQ
jgi:dTDP-4-dehydrorhamnose reductase